MNNYGASAEQFGIDFSKGFSGAYIFGQSVEFSSRGFLDSFSYEHSVCEVGIG